MATLSLKKRPASRLEAPTTLPTSKRHRRSYSQPAVCFGAFTGRQCMANKLPAELWQRILSLIPPHTLAVMTAVSKLFRRYLDPLASAETTGKYGSGFSMQSPDIIWQSSRRIFWPEMPAPIKGRNEIDMWRLCCSPLSCQFCGVLDGSPHSMKAQGTRRSGPCISVSPVFAFFVIACGDCLQERTIKELDVVLSPSMPHSVLTTLPWVFLTSEFHVLPSEALPATKEPAMAVVWKAQVDKTRIIFDTVKGYGPQFVKEWIRKRKQHLDCTMADVRKWETWFQSRGVEVMRATTSHFAKKSTTTSDCISTATTSSSIPMGISTALLHVNHHSNGQGSARLDQQQHRATPDPIEEHGHTTSLALQKNPQKIPIDDSGAAVELRRRQDRLEALVNDFLKSQDLRGQALSAGHSATTVFPLLTYIRTHFYAEAKMPENLGTNGREGSAGKAESAPNKKLTLWDMNWLFTSVLRYRVKHFREKLFSCVACHKNANEKKLKLEAVLHHYASTHTDTAERRGKPDWSAEWPEFSIFKGTEDFKEPRGTHKSAPYKSLPNSHQTNKRAVSTSDSLNSRGHKMGTVAKENPMPLDNSRLRKRRAKFQILADIAKYVWSNVSGVKGLKSPTRACVVFHCVATNYRKAQRHDITLGLFLDFISEHQDMHPLRHMNGLLCRVCWAGNPGSKSKKRTLEDLIAHFRHNHLRQLTPLLQTRLQWQNSILAWPETEYLMTLPKLLQNNARALAMVSSTFPLAFAAGSILAVGGVHTSPIEKSVLTNTKSYGLQDPPNASVPSENAGPSELRQEGDVGNGSHPAVSHVAEVQEYSKRPSSCHEEPVRSSIRDYHRGSSDQQRALLVDATPGRQATGPSYGQLQASRQRPPLVQRDHCNTPGHSPSVRYASAERDAAATYMVHPSRGAQLLTRPQYAQDLQHSWVQPQVQERQRIQSVPGARYGSVRPPQYAPNNEAHGVWRVCDWEGEYLVQRPVHSAQPSGSRRVGLYYPKAGEENVRFTTPHHSIEPPAASHSAQECEEYDPRSPLLHGPPRGWY